MGCENHVFVLNSILQCKLNTKKGRVFALFVNLSKAFNSISHSKLWTRLRKIGLSDKFLSYIQRIYKNYKYISILIYDLYYHHHFIK
jgi:hypothetical protein